MASSSSTLDVPPSSNTAMAITGDIGAEGDVLRSVEDVRGGYEGCNGAGGKLRSSKRASAKKTPYDRPPLGRHARRRGFRPAPFSSGSSITSQIMGSASRLISSSASYLFSSLFTGRKSPAITQGREKVAEGSVGAIERQSSRKNMAITITKQDANSSDKEMLKQVDAKALVRKPDELAREEIGVSQIEEIIKRQTWSREQVDRLTKVLQSCVADTSTGTTTTTTIFWKRLRLHQFQRHRGAVKNVRKLEMIQFLLKLPGLTWKNVCHWLRDWHLLLGAMLLKKAGWLIFSHVLL